VSLTLWRTVLAPLTSIRALRIQRRSKPPLSYDAAWRQARMLTCPDEMVYRLYGHQAADTPPSPNKASSDRSPSDPA